MNKNINLINHKWMKSFQMKNSRLKLILNLLKKVNINLSRRTRGINSQVNISPSVYWDYRVCAWICFKYSFISTTLGSVSSSCSAFSCYFWSDCFASTWKRLLRHSRGKYFVIQLFLIFPFYLAVTFGVLICMDSMECFLHSLRLHWVEFQNKFYEGKGYLFEPFSFRTFKW